MRIALVSRYPRVDVPRWKRELAKGLLGAGHEVGVLYSRSTLRDQARAGLRELGPRALPAYAAAALPRPGGSDDGGGGTLAGFARARGLALMLQRRLGDPDAHLALRTFGPDLLILTGADIVPPALLEVPRRGAINPHYGLLPRYRGMNVTEWSIYQDDPLGVSIHDVEPGIDTGDVRASERITAMPGDDLARLRERHQEAAARLLLQTVQRIGTGDSQGMPQRLDEGRQYFRMHPRLRAVVEGKLADHSYRWLGVTADD